MSLPKIYQVPIVCKNGKCEPDYGNIRIKDSDEGAGKVPVLAPGDTLEFSIPDPDEPGAVGEFAIVVVLDEDLVEQSHVRVNPGEPASIVIVEDEDTDDDGGEGGDAETGVTLEFFLFCHTCSPDSELESARRGNRMRVDPKPRRKPSSTRGRAGSRPRRQPPRPKPPKRRRP